MRTINLWKILLVFCVANSSACIAQGGTVLKITDEEVRSNMKITYSDFIPGDLVYDLYITTETNDLYRFDFKKMKFIWEVNISKKETIINEPTMSGDRQKLAYIYDNDVYLYELEAKKTTRLTSGQRVFRQMSWKSDTELLFTSYELGASRGSIKRVNINTGKIDTIIGSDGKNHYAVEEFTPETGELFFSFNDNATGHISQSSLYRSTLPVTKASIKEIEVNKDGIMREMGGEVDISPDGKWVLFHGAYRDTNSPHTLLFVVNVETGKIKTLFFDEHNNIRPVFSADMKKIAFLTQFENSQDLDIRMIDVPEGFLEKLGADTNGTDLSTKHLK